MKWFSRRYYRKWGRLKLKPWAMAAERQTYTRYFDYWERIHK